MYDLFRALAAYNRSTNAAIMSLMRSADEGKLTREHPTYYKSVLRTLLHLLRSDIRWLQRFSVPLGSAQANLDFEGMGVQEYLRRRVEVDEEMVRLIDGMKARDFSEVIRVEFGKGMIERPLWQLLLQWFTHHTHHRGQVSVQLDLEGVDNDYSGLLDKI